MKYLIINYNISFKFHGAILYQIMDDPSIISLLRNFIISGHEIFTFLYIFEFNLLLFCLENICTYIFQRLTFKGFMVNPLGFYARKPQYLTTVLRGETSLVFVVKSPSRMIFSSVHYDTATDFILPFCPRPLASGAIPEH